MLQGVFEVKPDGAGLLLTELAEGVSVQDIVENTECEFEVHVGFYMSTGIYNLCFIFVFSNICIDLLFK